MKRHQKVKHEGIPNKLKYSCGYFNCGKLFECKSWLKRHQEKAGHDLGQGQGQGQGPSHQQYSDDQGLEDDDDDDSGDGDY